MHAQNVKLCKSGHRYVQDQGPPTCPVCDTEGTRGQVNFCGQLVRVGQVWPQWCSPLCASFGYHVIEDREDGDN